MRRLLYPIWNAGERRPRAFVRIGLQLLVFALFSAIVQLAFFGAQRVVGRGWALESGLFFATSPLSFITSPGIGRCL